ncbi:sperm acrosome membrane-associated protein 6 isoform X5 [Anser cygnoides]|uniref:sperm acrosome membrane-associated protein 6 isoform X5 n=1 Tax=Anser cygnoides TaxID=8845 RepID=UPI0006713F22|nr:sperm acrosome membrane-associated protein 6 isoform X5 [Anser cygnoides]
MGWWVSLLLVLAPWLPGHPGIQPVEPGLWQWVVLVPWLPGVCPCLLCFGPPMQWTRLCHDITRTSLKGPQQQHCLEALAEAAVPLAPVTVGSGQREALREIIMDALHFLEKQKEIRYQPAARIFQCATCRLVDCQFPLDCPVQDVWVHEDEAITLHCDVPFAVPPDLPITWMFAKDIRTQDLALFEELQESLGEPPSLTLQDPTLGTIACRLGAPSETLARKYFYLNGAHRNLSPPRAVSSVGWSRTPRHLGQQKRNWGPLGGVSGNLQSLPDPCDSQASQRPRQQGPQGEFRFTWIYTTGA